MPPMLKGQNAQIVARERWQKAGRIHMLIVRMQNLLNRSVALGASVWGGEAEALEGQQRHRDYLKRLRRGVNIITVLESGVVRREAMAKSLDAENQAAIASGSVIMQAASAAELEAIPLWMQGNESLNTSEVLRQRMALRYDKRVLEVLQMFWETALRSTVPIEEGGGDTRAEGITYEGYGMMLARVYRVMIKDCDDDDLEQSIEVDWQHDAKGAELLNRKAFCDSMFELADSWTAGVCPYEYSAFLKRIYALVTEDQSLFHEGMLLDRVKVWKDEDDVEFDEATFGEAFTEEDGEEAEDDDDADGPPISIIRRKSKKVVKESQEKRACATRVQANYRGKKGRGEEKKKQKAVVLFEAHCRGHIARKAVRVLKEEKAAESKYLTAGMPPAAEPQEQRRKEDAGKTRWSTTLPFPQMQLIDPGTYYKPRQTRTRQKKSIPPSWHGQPKSPWATNSKSMPQLPTREELPKLPSRHELLMTPITPAAPRQTPASPEVLPSPPEESMWVPEGAAQRRQRRVEYSYRSPFLAAVSEADLLSRRSKGAAVWNKAGSTASGRHNKLVGRAFTRSPPRPRRLLSDLGD